MNQLEALTDLELLQLYSAVESELQQRGLVRTKNILGDYTEWLVSSKLGFTLVSSSTAGYDAIDDQGVTYQIKGRRLAKTNPSRQLSAIRNLEKHDFDYLIGVIYNTDFSIRYAYKLPHNAVVEHSRFISHTNSHLLMLRESLLSDSRVEDITLLLSQ